MGAARKFDHDECRALYATGAWTYRTLAEHFGVSAYAIGYALNPRVKEYKLAYQRAHFRGPCVNGCGNEVWTQGRGRTGKCRPCVQKERVTTVRNDALKCVCCQEWKPDTGFPRHASSGYRRGRHSTCTACQTKGMAAWRAANREHVRAYDRERKRRQRAAV